MGDEHAREIRAYFSRMNTAGNEYDCLASGYQFPRLLVAHTRWSEFAWVGKQILDMLVLFQPRQVLWRADGGHDERFIHGRLTECFKLYAIAGFGKLIKVTKHLVPARELTIIAGNEPKHILRSWDWSRLGCGDGSCGPLLSPGLFEGHNGKEERESQEDRD